MAHLEAKTKEVSAIQAAREQSAHAVPQPAPTDVEIAANLDRCSWQLPCLPLVTAQQTGIHTAGLCMVVNMRLPLRQGNVAVAMHMTGLCCVGWSSSFFSLRRKWQTQIRTPRDSWGTVQSCGFTRKQEAQDDLGGSSCDGLPCFDDCHGARINASMETLREQEQPDQVGCLLQCANVVLLLCTVWHYESDTEVLSSPCGTSFKRWSLQYNRSGKNYESL